MNLKLDIISHIRNLSDKQPVITVIRDLNFDYIFNYLTLEPGKEIIIQSFTKNLTGTAGYVSCGLVKLGAQVLLYTKLGNDEGGKLLLKEIEKIVINKEGIQFNSQNKSPFTLIFTEKQESQPR